MARIQGKFVDETTGKGLSGVNMDVFIGPDMSGTPAGSFQSDTDG